MKFVQQLRAGGAFPGDTGRSRLLSAAVLVALVLACSCSEEFGNRLSGFDTEQSAADTPGILTGRVLLDDQDDHAMVRVELVDIHVSMLTDGDGEYDLPNNLSEGEWRIQASYPYYHSADISVLIVNGKPDSSLATFHLTQAIKFTVTTNGRHFQRGSTVQITLAVENVSTERFTLSSDRYPAAAFAVRRGDEVVHGSLFPGEEATSSEIVLEPGDTQYFKMTWKIDNPSLEPGNYEIFGLLTSNASFPDYFDPSTADSVALNESLYAKLTPAEIKLD